MRKVSVLAFLAVLASTGAVIAQQADIPLRNWTVPPYSATGSSGGITTMTDVTDPRLFIGIAVCRLLDTRPPANNPLDGDGAYGPDAIRTYTLWGACGIPTGADAVSINLTVTNTGNHPFGHLKVWPTGQAEPNVSTLNWSTGGVTESNAAIVALSATGQISIKTGNIGADVIMDVNGYFSDFLQAPANYLSLTNNSSQYTIYADNNSTTCSGPCGVRADVSSGHAIEGNAYKTTGVNHGVNGYSASADAFAAGVRGHANVAAANGAYFSNAGTGDVYLATEVSGVDYAVNTGDRVLAGSLQISPGPKNFVAPHPEDASLEIQYASVEAPTVDVYFRGTASLVNGIGRIEVPDHFRFTAREGTYMTTLTSVGRTVALSVESEGPEGIVVRGTGNTQFHYVVYAERAEIEGFEPVTRNTVFIPEMIVKRGGPDALPAATRALLVKNGTLNPDGTFNLDTARAHGWVVPSHPRRPDPQQPSP